jgi:EAL domain-containing protein (putative c-di-GMP-specific phosphodiesterase class I)
MAHAAATPSWVTLEVTESMLMQNSSAYLERLHAVRALGVQIAIDDFGTGYSSLAYLERFPVTHIKIDRSFVTPLDDPGHGSGVVRAIVEIGRALSLTTVAEGIETPTELQRLRELGCVLGQGYLFAKPLERDAMADLVARKTGPVFAREVAMADRQGTVRAKRSTPARSEPPAGAKSGTRPRAEVRPKAGVRR